MRISIIALCLLWAGVAHANTELDAAIANVRAACNGISSELGELKKMAGINTAVTGVGTAAAGVALGTGLAKANTDARLAKIEERLSELENSQPDNTNLIAIADDAKFSKDLATFEKQIAKHDKESLQKLQTQETEKSITLGNVRTGTMAAATVTNIAGTAIAGTNKIDGDFATKIGACSGAVQALKVAKMTATIDASAKPEQITQADKIISACDQYDVIDIASINKRAAGATLSSGVGAGLGLAGTVTSALANTDKTRDGDEKKEKTLNTTANILAGGTTAASLTSTIFNATQIAAIKRVVAVADECEGALKQ
jgi:hypothetical protein